MKINFHRVRQHPTIQLSNYYVTQNVSIQIAVNLILLDKQSILLPDIFFQTALSIIR